MMRNREIGLIVLSVAMLIVSLCLHIRHSKLNDTWKDTAEVIERLETEHDMLNSYRLNRHHEFMLNGTLISGRELVSDTTGIRHTVTDIINHKTLVFRYSSTNCLSCIEAQLETLNAMSDSIDFDIVLFASHTSDLEMKRFIKIHKITHKVYRLGETLNELIKDIGIPYYFVIDRDSRRLNKMFVPMKESPSLTKDYLKSVEATYAN